MSLVTPKIVFFVLVAGLLPIVAIADDGIQPARLQTAIESLDNLASDSQQQADRVLIENLTIHGMGMFTRSK